MIGFATFYPQRINTDAIPFKGLEKLELTVVHEGIHQNTRGKVFNVIGSSVHRNHRALFDFRWLTPESSLTNLVEAFSGRNTKRHWRYIPAQKCTDSTYWPVLHIHRN